MISTCLKVMETTNSQNQTIKPAYFIVWLQLWNIKVFTYKHGLNIGQDTCSGISNLSPSTMNKQKSVLQALLTHIRLTNECMICMLTPIISV